MRLPLQTVLCWRYKRRAALEQKQLPRGRGLQKLAIVGLEPFCGAMERNRQENDSQDGMEVGDEERQLLLYLPINRSIRLSYRLQSLNPQHNEPDPGLGTAVENNAKLTSGKHARQEEQTPCETYHSGGSVSVAVMRYSVT